MASSIYSRRLSLRPSFHQYIAIDSPLLSYSLRRVNRYKNVEQNLSTSVGDPIKLFFFSNEKFFRFTISDFINM